jgi:hypothetical protein
MIALNSLIEVHIKPVYIKAIGRTTAKKQCTICTILHYDFAELTWAGDYVIGDSVKEKLLEIEITENILW